MKIGIIGAGQLGQMLGLAGKSLELEFTFLDPARPSIGKPGAINAALLAAAILGSTNETVATALEEYRQSQTNAVLAQSDPRSTS